MQRDRPRGDDNVTARRQRAAPTLAQVLGTLRTFHGAPARPPVTDPFEMILWENVAYLVADAQRAEAFDILRRRVGTTPGAIRAAKTADLLAVAERGGMRPMDRVARLRTIADLAIEECDGDLRDIVRRPPAEAKRILRKFPSIGEPSAEKILMTAAGAPILALESNGLRVLVRVGFAAEKKSYAATYRAVQEAIATQLPSRAPERVAAHALLRQHGQTLCKTTRPACPACPLAGGCAYRAGTLSF